MATMRTDDWTPIEDELRGFCEALYVLTCKIARYFIEDQEMQREVSHSAWLRIIRHRHKLYAWEDYQRFGFILKAVVRHHWRMRKQAGRFLLLDSTQDEDGESQDPLQQIVDETYEPHQVLVEKLERKLFATLVRVAREALTEDQRDIVELRLAGKSFGEIGGILGRSEGACRKSWHYITKKLTRVAQERGVIRWGSALSADICSCLPQ